MLGQVLAISTLASLSTSSAVTRSIQRLTDFIDREPSFLAIKHRPLPGRCCALAHPNLPRHLFCGPERRKLAFDDTSRAHRASGEAQPAKFGNPPLTTRAFLALGPCRGALAGLRPQLARLGCCRAGMTTSPLIVRRRWGGMRAKMARCCGAREWTLRSEREPARKRHSYGHVLGDHFSCQRCKRLHANGHGI